MLRAKAVRLHPSAMTIQANQFRYVPATDPEVERFTSDSPLDSVWHGLYLDPFLDSWCIVKDYQFHSPADVDLTTLWSQYKDVHGATVPTIASGQGGGMQFSTGNVGGAGVNYVYEDYGIFSFQPGKTTWIEIEFKTTLGFAVGFGDSYNYDPLHGPIPVYPDNGFTVTSSGWITTFNAGVEEFQVDVDGHILEDEFVRMGLRVEPNESEPDKFDVVVFQDDEYIGTYYGVEIPSETCGIMYGTYFHDQTVVVRSTKVIQEKSTD